MPAALSFDEMYQAMLDRNTAYEGVFVVGVKTTGIFCRPGCSARSPKRENVIFLADVEAALQHGFRACKVCKPTLKAGETPREIAELIKELSANPQLVVRDQGLIDRGLEPATVRRWFKKHHGITFHAYQRMQRINVSFQNLQKGNTVTKTAFENGYDSLSGFGEGFKNLIGKAPSDLKGKTVINIVRFTTPLGPMFGCANDDGVCLCEFTDRRMLESEFKDLSKRMNAEILPGTHPFLDQLQAELGEYFDKKKAVFEVKLNSPGSAFQNSVWQELRTIPFGQTRSYKAQAQKLGNEKAIRAVATANGMNRIAIVIPCHRVIGSDGSMTGYAGGIPRKKWLLAFEGAIAKQGELF